MSLKDLISKMRYVKYGDILLPEDHNTFVDAFKAVDAKFDSIDSKIIEIENIIYNIIEKKVTGVAKALVDPSGKYSQYKTIADALEALDDKGVEAAVIYIVPPDDILTYSKVVENKQASLSNIRFIYVNGRGMEITFDLLYKTWITLTTDKLTVIFENAKIYSVNTSPSTLFYSKNLVEAKFIGLNLEDFMIYNSVTIGGQTKRTGATIFYSEASSSLSATIVLRNVGRRRIIEPLPTLSAIGQPAFNPNANAYTAVSIFMYNSALAFTHHYDPDINDVYYLTSDRGRIDLALLVGSVMDCIVDEYLAIEALSSQIYLSKPPDPFNPQKIYELYVKSGVVNINTIADIFDAMIYSSDTYVNQPATIYDPIIRSTRIVLDADLMLYRNNRLDIEGLRVEETTWSLMIFIGANQYGSISSSKILSPLDLSFADPTSKLLFLSNITDRTKINDPNNVLLSNGGNIDVSTWTVF